MSFFFLAFLACLCLATGLLFALGAGVVAVVPLALIVLIGVWLIWALAGGRSPREMTRHRHKAELLGPGGPDDPDRGL